MSVMEDKKYDGNVFPLRLDWVRDGRLTQMYQTFNILSVKDTEGFQSLYLNVSKVSSKEKQHLLLLLKREAGDGAAPKGSTTLISNYTTLCHPITRP